MPMARLEALVPDDDAATAVRADEDEAGSTGRN